MNILITGCSRGLGRDFLEKYLKQADVKKVWAVSTNTDKLNSLAATYPEKLKLVAASVSEESAKQKIISALAGEPLDLLINCAGTYPQEGSSFSEIKLSALKEGFEVNTCSAFLVTQACLPSLQKAAQKSKGVKVISISSLMGSISDNTSGGSYAYRISKTAMNMFNKCFSIEFPELTAVVLHPGWVKTDMGGDSAPTTIEESVSGMMKVIQSLSPKQTGHFIDFEGDEVEW